ncbi:hypothetical protein PVAND_000376 [Polypedilum vanderplanki]|uniref:Uncharacterized protein n=1 Tax=Polypedilum vanderplanki TaxID=319348 RepID=A0A9J6BJT5_POLVA|nr:hypothetical protein PVAND_000376 [Polypedilum vanderplanki]
MKTVAYIILLFLIAQNANAQVRQVACIFSQTPRGYECRLPDVDLSTLDQFEIVGGEHIPPNTDANVVSFMSMNNNFEVFPTNHLERFPNLQQIHITGSRIPELPPHSIFNRSTLTNLDLRSNFISRIDAEAFMQTTNIQTLNLQFNRLRGIDNEAFAQFPNLQNLDLSFNLLERISAATLVNNPALANIDFNNNRISHINQTFFSNVPSLLSFSFQTNLCYSGSFFNLNQPGSFNDMMTRLNPCFQNTALGLNCQFGYQFDGIEFEDRYTCLLRHIEAYDFGKTITLGGVHVAGRTNANVTYGWVDSSNVRFIIQSFFTTFVNLQGLQITGSNLQILQPGAFQGANNLKYLTILLNNVRTLEDYSFMGASNLEVIRFWYNNLEQIRQDAFAGLNLLRELHVLGGTLREIPPYTFQPLTNLQFVEFSQNYLEIIDSRWFENNQNIQQMMFNSNQIYAVYPDIVEMPFLTSLSLLNNTCIDAVFAITADTRDEVRTQLFQCFDNYPRRQRTLRLELSGNMLIEDDDGNLILEI